LIALAGVFLVLGFAEPLGAYYLPTLIKHANTKGVTITAPPPVPADGIGGYTSNALLIGLIVLVVVAASACAVDARPALSAFYRTRTPAFWRLLSPRFVVTSLAGVTAYLLGLLAAWYETRLLLGAPDLGGLAQSAGLVAVFLVFAVASTAVASTFARSTVATAAWSIGGLLVLNILGAVSQLAPWLPAALTDSPDALVRHTASAHHFLRALIVCAAATCCLLLVAGWRGARREVA
jgi:ABC-2 type transport system permease protein